VRVPAPAVKKPTGFKRRGSAATGQRAPGFTHYGLHVENAAAAAEMFKQRGATVTQTNVSAGTESIPQISPIRTWAASSWSKSLLNHCINTQAIQHWK